MACNIYVSFRDNCQVAIDVLSAVGRKEAYHSVQVRVRAAAVSGVNAKAGVNENQRQKAIAVDSVLTCGCGAGRACVRGAPWRAHGRCTCGGRQCAA